MQEEAEEVVNEDKKEKKTEEGDEEEDEAEKEKKRFEEPLVELERLAVVVKAMVHDCLIVPKGK